MSEEGEGVVAASKSKVNWGNEPRSLQLEQSDQK